MPAPDPTDGTDVRPDPPGYQPLTLHVKRSTHFSHISPFNWKSCSPHTPRAFLSKQYVLTHGSVFSFPSVISPASYFPERCVVNVPIPSYRQGIIKRVGGGSEPDSSLTNEMDSEMDTFLAMHCLMRKLMSTTFKTGNPLVNLSGMVISMVFRDLLMRKAFGNILKAHSRGF